MQTQLFTLVGYYVDSPHKRHQYFDSFFPILRSSENKYFAALEGTDPTGRLILKDVIPIAAEISAGISQEIIDQEIERNVVFLFDEHQRRSITVGDDWVYILVSSDCTLIGTQASLKASRRLPRLEEIHPSQREEYKKAGIVEM